MTGDGINTRTVMTAIRALHERTGKWPTRDEIAAYLEVQISVVKSLLLQLRQKRLFRDRVREGATRWMPWDEP
jgi:DNA-directed RNA polymerase specialized sigma subunit